MQFLLAQQHPGGQESRAFVADSAGGPPRAHQAAGVSRKKQGPVMIGLWRGERRRPTINTVAAAPDLSVAAAEE